MKKLVTPTLIVTVALAFGFTQNVVAATSSAKPMTAQQSKFARCAHESKGKKGAEHRKFMHECLQGKSGKTPATPPAKQDKKKDAGGN